MGLFKKIRFIYKEKLMTDLWVVDTKCKVHPESSMPQDGSAFYYGRSAVPASSKETAIATLSLELEDDRIGIEEVLSAVPADSQAWPDDDDFEICESLEEAKETGKVVLGCFISEQSM